MSSVSDQRSSCWADRFFCIPGEFESASKLGATDGQPMDDLRMDICNGFGQNRDAKSSTGYGREASWMKSWITFITFGDRVVCTTSFSIIEARFH